MNKNLLYKIWFIFFLYTAAVSVFVQFIFLPYIMPSGHAGDGLINSLLDSQSFHRMASAMAYNIHDHGWSAWRFRPDGQAPVGIVAAIYTLTFSKPWVLIPLNAFIHATSAVILLQITRIFIPGIKKAILCVLPFLLYPSAATWYAQIHKDGYFILGLFLVVYSWIIFSNCILSRKKIDFIKTLIFLISGTFLIWYVRMYLLQPIMVIEYIIIFIIFVSCLSYLYKIKKMRKTLNLFSKCILLIFVVHALPYFENRDLKNYGSKIVDSRFRKFQALEYSNIDNKIVDSIAPSSIKLIRSQSITVAPLGGFQKLADTIIKLRNGYIRANIEANAKSSIDNDLQFKDVSSIFLYIPRAIQIILFAPFPNTWFEETGFQPNVFMRRVSSFEMLGVYFALFFLIFSIWFWKKRVELWIILIICTGILLLQGLVINNIGTLYRLRYGMLMLLVTLGMAGFIKLLEKICVE